MNKKEEELSEKKKKIKQFMLRFLEDREKWLFYGLITFTIIFKLYYFAKTLNQAVWWDEGDYLAVGKELFMSRARPEWWSHFTGIRPLLMPLTWGVLFFMNFSESFVKLLTLVIPSVLTVVLVYFTGKDLFGKGVAFISSLMLSVYWVHNFYTFRFLTDIPAMFFGMASIYFFWSIYITKKENWGLYLAMVFGVLGFSTRFPLALVPLSFALYLFTIRGWKIVKDKVLWKGLGVALITFSPYLIYFIYSKFAVFDFYFGESAVSMTIPISTAFKSITQLIPSLIGGWWFWCLLLGLATLYKLAIGFDLLLRQKTEELNADYFVFLWGLLTFFFYIVIVKAANDRWLLMAMPPLFYFAAKGIIWIFDILKKYHQLLAVTAVIVFVVFGAKGQMDHTDSLIREKVETYKEEKIAGLWLRENTPEDAAIIVASIVQNQYYSERQSYDFHSKKGDSINCYDLYGKLKPTEECINQTEAFFREKVKEIDADYMIIHIFEPVFTPQWAYTYPDRHPGELRPIKPYVNAQGQPVLVIYQFNKSSEVFM